MKIISHRGNIDGICEKYENDPKHIEKTLKKFNFDIEIDLRIINKILYLGHDIGTYEINEDFLFLNKKRLWIHCKDLESLSFCLKNGLRCFSHDIDDYTITSDGYIWAYPHKPVNENCISVVLDQIKDGQSSEDLKRVFLDLRNHCVFGICTDYPLVLNEL